MMVPVNFSVCFFTFCIVFCNTLGPTLAFNRIFQQGIFPTADAKSSRSYLTILQLTTSDFKNGLNIELDGVPVKIMEFMHVKPGKGAAFVRSKVKNLLTGSLQEKTFRAGETVVPADILKTEMKYSYADGDNLCFLDMETFDETRVNKKTIENWELLNEGSICQLTIWNGNVVDVQLPLQSKCAVIDITRNGGQNIAKLENGMDVSVPAFVRIGDVIVVTTDDGKYVSRE